MKWDTTTNQMNFHIFRNQNIIFSLFLLIFTGSHCSCAFGGRCSPDSYSDNIASICRCDNFQCDSTPIEPICANDNKTYNNLCQLNLTSCNLQLPLTVQYKGTCDNGKWSFHLLSIIKGLSWLLWLTFIHISTESNWEMMII